MQYETARNCIAVFLSAYLLIGIWAYYFADKHEIYPFFSWAIFQKVPQHEESYIYLEFTGVAGEKLEQPISAQDAERKLGFPNVSIYRPLSDAIAQALTQGDPNHLKSSRANLEALLGTPVSYRLVRVTYDPIERWKDGSIISSEIIRTFESGTYDD